MERESVLLHRYVYPLASRMQGEGRVAQYRSALRGSLRLRLGLLGTVESAVCIEYRKVASARSVRLLGSRAYRCGAAISSPAQRL